MALFENLKLKILLNSVLAEVEKTKSINGLVQFLAAHSQMDKQVEAIAQARNIHNFNRDALLFTVALAVAGSARALNPLKKLIEHSLNPSLAKAWPIPWEQLSPEQLRQLRLYIAKSGTQLLKELFHCLSTEQSLYLLGRPTDHDFEIAIEDYLKAKHLPEPLAGFLVFEIEQSVFAQANNRRLLTVAGRIAKSLWDMEYAAAALDLLTACTLAAPQACVPDWLDVVASLLPALDGVSLIRASTLLRRYPSRNWIVPLKKTWVKLKRQLHAEQEHSHEEGRGGMIRTIAGRDAIMTYSIASVAVALGVAAACDSDYLELEDKTPDTKEIENSIQRRNDLFKQHQVLVREYRQLRGFRAARQREIEEQLKEIQDAIHKVDTQIEQLSRQSEEHMSPGLLLALALQDEQAYPAPVRQSAAWGLFRLIETGHLNETSRQKARALIDRSIFDQDEKDLREQILGLKLDEQVSNSVWEAARQYRELRNWSQLVSQIIAFGLEDEVRDRILTLIRAFDSETSPSYHFQERVVQFSTGQRFLELEQAILDALVWMLDLIETKNTQEELENWDYTEVRQILRLISEQIPNALEFFGKYPLRLMSSKQHQQILGKFSRAKAGITEWTRYTPPLWKRDAPPEQIGIVRKRYLEMDDRSAPNAMGISWQLFSHPVLAVPVMYHEFMHYGGPTGNPDQGIDNECEVHLREVIFARGLIAQTAPEQDDDIPEYERRLAAEMRKTGQIESLQKLLVDFKDNRNLTSLNNVIERAYGRQLNKEEAAVEISRIVDHENISIQLSNVVDEMKRNWQPEIEWPLLNTDQTRTLTGIFCQVLHRSFTTSHRLNPEERDAVLRDPALQQYQAAWAAYIQRPYALNELVRGAGFQLY